MQYMPPANGPTGNRSDDRFGNGTDDFLKIKNVESRNSILTHISTVTPHTLIATTAERLSTFSGKDNHSYIAVFATPVHGVDHLLHRERRESIVYFRPVNADAGDALVLVEENLFVLLNFFPGIFTFHNVVLHA